MATAADATDQAIGKRLVGNSPGARSGRVTARVAPGDPRDRPKLQIDALFDPAFDDDEDLRELHEGSGVVEHRFVARRIFLFPPLRDFQANRVDRRVLLFRFLFQIAEKRLARFSRLGNRYPVAARSSPFGNSVREAIVVESVVVARFEKRRIQDRIFNREWRHVSPA